MSLALTLLLAAGAAGALWLLSWYIMVGSRRARLVASLPGPPPLPLIGNALMFGNNAVEVTQGLIKLWQEYGYVTRAWLGPFLFVLLAEPKWTEAILSSNINITKSINYRFLQPWLGTGLLTSTGGKWKSHRKIITPTFHFKILEQFVEVFNKYGNVMVKKLKKEVDGPDFDIHEYVTLCALDIISETAMGVQMNVQDNGNSEYVSALKSLAEIIMKRSVRPWIFADFLFNFSELGRKQKEYVKILHDTSYKVIANKKKELFQQKSQEANRERVDEFGQKKRLAFLDLLLQHNRDEGILSDEEIREEVDTFMFEGHDTVSSGISYCLWLLSQNPKCQEKAFEELKHIFGESDRNATMEDLQNMKYLDCVVKETMRIFPSVPLYLRELDEDVKIDDVTLLSGTTVILFPYGMHRNPKYFPEPEKFDPDRFSADNSRGRHPYVYVPFSAGPRNCIGQKFAMLEMKSMVSKILRNFKLLPGSKELELSFDLVLKSHEGVCVKLQNRND